MPPTIEQVIAAIPDWAGRQVTAERIPAGLTNTNYRVEVDGTPYFVRIPGAVDRPARRGPRERAAQHAGRSRDGRRRRGSPIRCPSGTCSCSTGCRPRRCRSRRWGRRGCPTRLAETLRRLHAGPRFRDDFDMFRLSERYLALVDERDIAIPAGYREHLTQLPGIEAALAAPSARARPVPQRPARRQRARRRGPALDRRLRVQRHERPGLRARQHLPGARLRRRPRSPNCVARTSARRTPALLARMRLQMIMSDVGWTLWAAIQAAISTIDYDFGGWAEERWARATAMLDGPDFGAWLDAV